MLYIDGIDSYVDGNVVDIVTKKTYAKVGTVTQATNKIYFDGSSYLTFTSDDIHDVIANGDFTIDYMLETMEQSDSNCAPFSFGSGSGPRGLWTWAGSRNGAINGFACCESWKTHTVVNTYGHCHVTVRCVNDIVYARVSNENTSENTQFSRGSVSFDNKGWICKLGSSLGAYKTNLYKVLFYSRYVDDAELLTIRSTDLTRFGF